MVEDQDKLKENILQEILTCGGVSGDGCGKKLEKYHTGLRLLWSCPACGELGNPIPDDNLQVIKRLLEPASE